MSSVTAALVSDELWILVSDDGCGLEPRTNRPGLGLGLGLTSGIEEHAAAAAAAFSDRGAYVAAVLGTAGGPAATAGSTQATKPAVPVSDNTAAMCSPRSRAVIVPMLMLQGFTVKLKCPSVLWVSTEVTCHSTL